MEKNISRELASNPSQQKHPPKVTRRSQLPRWASAAPGPNALLQALQRGDEAMALRLLNSNLSIMNLWLVNQLVSLNTAL